MGGSIECMGGCHWVKGVTSRGFKGSVVANLGHLPLLNYEVRSYLDFK